MKYGFGANELPICAKAMRRILYDYNQLNTKFGIYVFITITVSKTLLVV
jgi:hypothetical protein